MIFYTENDGEPLYCGFVEEFKKGFITGRKCLKIKYMGVNDEIYKTTIYLDNENLKIYTYHIDVEDTVEKCKEVKELIDKKLEEEGLE